MEGERKDLMDDKLPHRKMAEVELADALIRIFDYAGAYGYDPQQVRATSCTLGFFFRGAGNVPLLVSGLAKLDFRSPTNGTFRLEGWALPYAGTGEFHFVE